MIDPSKLIKEKRVLINNLGHEYVDLNIEVILRHPDGRVGNVITTHPWFFTSFYDGSSPWWTPEHAVIYSWVDDSCDCNLMRYFDPHWADKEYPCTDDIEVLKIVVEGEIVFVEDLDD